MLDTPPGPVSRVAGDDKVVNLHDWKKEREQQLTQMGARLMKMVLDARRSPLGLYRLCFTDDRGDAVVIKWFHKEWTELIMHNRNVMIEAPRGSSKTTFIICMVLFLLGHNQNLRIKLICGNDSNAAKRLSAIRQYITEDPLYRLVFPDVKVHDKLKNDSANLNLVRERKGKDATIEARGVSSDGTGDRADLIIFDDICTYKNSIQDPALRPKVVSKVRGEWLNTLNPRDGRVISIFTPYHEEDCNAVLKREAAETGRWVYKRYAHGKPGDPFHSIFPELFSHDMLLAKYDEVGSLEYARAYLCKALSEDAQLVHAEWLRTYTKLDLPAEVLNRTICVLSVDPSGGKKSEAANAKDIDYIGITVGLVDLNPENPERPEAPHRIYIADSYQIQLTQAQLVEHIIDLHTKWLPDYTVIESQNAQDLAGWLHTRAPHIYVEPMPTGTLSKRERLRGVTPWMEDPREIVLFNKHIIAPSARNIRIHLKRPTPQNADVGRKLRHQLLNFPTKHDDIMDSFVQLLRFLRYYIIAPDETVQEDPDAPVSLRTPEVDLGVKIVEIG